MSEDAQGIISAYKALTFVIIDQLDSAEKYIYDLESLIDKEYKYVTTTEAKQSEMTFRLAYPGYYAGAEVQAAYPGNFTGDISNFAIFHLKAEATPQDRMYYKYYYFLDGDYTNPEKFSDEEAI